MNSYNLTNEQRRIEKMRIRKPESKMLPLLEIILVVMVGTVGILAWAAYAFLLFLKSIIPK